MKYDEGHDVSRLARECASRLVSPWRDEELSAHIDAMYTSATAPAHRQRTHGGIGTASPTGHLSSYSRQRIIAHMQDLARNNNVARAIVARNQEYTVGDGPVVTSLSEDAEFVEWADSRFKDWAEQAGEYDTGDFDVAGRHNLASALGAVVRAWQTDGDVLWVVTRSGTVQLVPSLLIRTESTNQPTSLPSGNELVDGIEIDEDGRIVGYHIGRWDVRSQSRVSDIRRVVATNYHLFLPNPNTDSVGALRGEPGLQAQWESLIALESYIRNSAVAAEIATYFGVVVKSNNPTAMQEADEAAYEGSQPTSGAKRVTLEPAMVKHIGANESIEQIKPEFPTMGFREFVRTMLMMIGAESGIPSSVLAFDSDGMSWANSRALLAMAARRREIEQDRLVRVVRTTRAAKVQQWAEDEGRTLPDDWRRCNVMFPRPPVLSFGDEVKGLVAAVEANMMTLTQATETIGSGDALRIIQRRGIEREAEHAANVVPMGQPGASPAYNRSPEMPGQADQGGDETTDSPDDSPDDDQQENDDE